MEAYILDWLNLLGRWLHVITGVAWIGASFYFVWLDNHLLPPQSADDEASGVGGEVWSVHGGGFYHAQKYRVAPPALPAVLHWFKWEAYSTWLSGIFLLALIYWYGADIYLIDRSVAELSAGMAVALGMAVIAGGWLVYDVLCRSPLGRNDAALSAVLFVLISLLAWWLCNTFSGRGAYMHFAALLGTIMVGNVFFVIIPGQQAMVAACSEGRVPDPAPGIKAKQRSVHNTYFTLPVLFVMVSNHYSMTYGHAYNWLILIAITLAGALIRVYFVARHKGPASPLSLIAGLIVLALTAAAMVPPPPPPPPPITEAVPVARLADVRQIIQARCINCHSSAPTYAAFSAAPSGVQLDTDEQILAAADRIYQQVVVTRAMPIGNLTEISDEERDLIGRWYGAGASRD